MRPALAPLAALAWALAAGPARAGGPVEARAAPTAFGPIPIAYGAALARSPLLKTRLGVPLPEHFHNLVSPVAVAARAKGFAPETVARMNEEQLDALVADVWDRAAALALARAEEASADAPAAADVPAAIARVRALDLAEELAPWFDTRAEGQKTLAALNARRDAALARRGELLTAELKGWSSRPVPAASPSAEPLRPRDAAAAARLEELRALEKAPRSREPLHEMLERGRRIAVLAAHTDADEAVGAAALRAEIALAERAAKRKDSASAADSLLSFAAEVAKRSPFDGVTSRFLREITDNAALAAVSDRPAVVARLVADVAERSRSRAIKEQALGVLDREISRTAIPERAPLADAVRRVRASSGAPLALRRPPPTREKRRWANIGNSLIGLAVGAPTAATVALAGDKIPSPWFWLLLGAAALGLGYAAFSAVLALRARRPRD